ncbi:uroporphyrin-III C-methyltransferase [Skeletonema marinoi]|uniref:Uroporphyrin-III C-methyltransferase n=1 Tax=Skeletonema marinoi TaxID=267567 RepID=A0AAD8YK33_9STRA|nr:uroporphyrin-III C-methyltransferase [Skeletonema marinoi]
MLSPLYFAVLLALLLSSSGGASALLVGGARTSRILRPSAAFHHCPSSVRSTSPSSLLQASSSSDNPSRTTSADDDSSLRETIERLVSLIGPPDDDNIVKPPTQNAQQNPSIVHIIGTGLTPSLLSLPLSTLHLLSQADAVLYDSLGLAYEDICKVVPKQCEVICVGKRGDSQKSWKQSEIDDLILQMAMTQPSSSTDGSTMTQSKTILRLKGGDPFLFGRARTEIDTLKSNNIPFGVWSGTDAFGRSRGLGTKNDNEGDDSGKWEGLGVDTLVFLMIGRLDKLEALCNLLASSGEKWEDGTPCAVIQNAGGRRSMQETDGSQDSSQKLQRVWRGTLSTIVPLIREEDETRTSVSPAVFIVGATCQLDFLSY